MEATTRSTVAAVPTRFAGEDGNDTIKAADGMIDTVSCGAGTDTLTAD